MITELKSKACALHNISTTLVLNVMNSVNR